jgi:hypothetical protein
MREYNDLHDKLPNLTPVYHHGWPTGLLLTATWATIYFALRPPLFGFDGYMYRLYALMPHAFYNCNPHHLLWNQLQILVAAAAASLGHPSAFPFQLFGILVNCTTLLLFYVLLRRVIHDSVSAIAGLLLIALSPAFWYLGFQNEPYPLAFLMMVVYLHFWSRFESETRSGPNIVGAGIALTLGALFHQAVILLVPAGMLALAIFGRRTLWQRLIVSLLWGGSIKVTIAAAYLWFWHAVNPAEAFLAWSTGYVHSLHPPQLLQLGFLICWAQSMIGFSAALLQTKPINVFLSKHLTTWAILLLYAALGVLPILAIGLLACQRHVRAVISQLAGGSPVFTVSIVSCMTWWAFAFSWEPETAQYWCLSLFPLILCVCLVLDGLAWRRWIVILSVFVLSGWNGYFNHWADEKESINNPDALLASIRSKVGNRDVFIVLANDHWFGDMDYHLLHNCLKYSARDPGLAILNDFVLTEKTQDWRVALRHKIDATLNSGGRVFVAAHVFDRNSYADLSSANQAFREQIATPYLRIDGNTIYAQVRQLLAGYGLRGSDFVLGNDRYFLLVKRRSSRVADAWGKFA